MSSVSSSICSDFKFNWCNFFALQHAKQYKQKRHDNKHTVAVGEYWHKQHNREICRALVIVFTYMPAVFITHFVWVYMDIVQSIVTVFIADARL